jgi:ABC-type sugar transport system substrate-binding protein
MRVYVECLAAGAAVAFVGILASPPAFADAVSDAKSAVARYAGPQTTWEGPTKGPKPEPVKKIVFLSGDEQNDISHLYGVYIKEAGEKLGWNVTVIDGKGSPTSWLAGMNQAIALKPDGIALFADAASLQDPIKAGTAQGIKFVGLHAACLDRSRISICSRTSRRIHARSARRRQIGRSPTQTAKHTSSS